MKVNWNIVSFVFAICHVTQCYSQLFNYLKWYRGQQEKTTALPQIGRLHNFRGHNLVKEHLYPVPDVTSGQRDYDGRGRRGSRQLAGLPSYQPGQTTYVIKGPSKFYESPSTTVGIGSSFVPPAQDLSSPQIEENGSEETTQSLLDSENYAFEGTDYDTDNGADTSGATILSNSDVAIAGDAGSAEIILPPVSSSSAEVQVAQDKPLVDLRTEVDKLRPQLTQTSETEKPKNCPSQDDMCVKWTKCQALDGKFTGVCGGETGFEVCCSIQPQQSSASTIAPTAEGLSSPDRPSTLDDTAVTTSLEQQPSVYNLPSILLSNSGGEEDGPAGSTGQSTVVVNLPEIVQVEEPASFEEVTTVSQIPEEFVVSASTPVVEVLPAPTNLLIPPAQSHKNMPPLTKVTRRKKLGMNSSRFNKMKIAKTSSCAAAMLCVEKSFCSLLGNVSKTRLEISPRDRLYLGVPLMSCRLTDDDGTKEMVCCRDLEYEDPWPRRRRTFLQA